MFRKPMALPSGIPSLSHTVTTAAYTDLVGSTREECVVARAMDHGAHAVEQGECAGGVWVAMSVCAAGTAVG